MINDTIIFYTKVKPEAADQRVKQTHKQVAFKDGIIVHENASGEFVAVVADCV
jgi:hypothetical protein